MALEGFIEKENPPHGNGRRKLHRRKWVNAHMGTPASFAEMEKLISGRDAQKIQHLPCGNILLMPPNFRSEGGEFPWDMLFPDIVLDVPDTVKSMTERSLEEKIED